MSGISVLSFVFIFLIRIRIRLRFPASKSVAQTIWDRYGKLILRLIHKFEGLDYKKKKTSLDIEFLEKCLEHNLVPTFVKFKTANRGLQTSVAYRQCQRKLLQQEVVNKRNYQKGLQRQFDNIGK